jgi:sulfhydrogenase subunit alpha
MSTTPLPSAGPAPVRAASGWAGGLAPTAVARLATIAASRDAMARMEPVGRDHAVHDRIVPPAKQNQGAIEADLAAFAPSVLDLPQTEAVHRLEMLIRAYDPCISCATHFLDLRIEEDGA